MKVEKKLTLEIPGTNTHYFNLDEFSEEDSNECLYYGYTFLEDGIDYNLLKKYDRNVYLNVTSPTEYCGNISMNREDVFDDVYSICPYTNKWLNEIKNTNRYKTTFYPFNKKDIPTNTEKKYDVIYHGGIHGEKYWNMLEAIRLFNYRFVTQTHGINATTQHFLPYATNTDLSNQEKLNLISECKISICFNTFDIRHSGDIHEIKSKPNWHRNEAFKHIEDLMIAPQFKSRCNEAAFSRTLNLVKRDPWNLIEKYYNLDEFVYFDSIEELPNKIQEILKNWEDYLPIIDRAYKKSLNYTTEEMYKLIKNKENKYEL